MAWTERYVRADAAGSGDGTTTANSGANGAFTLAEAITHSASNTGIRYNVMKTGGTFANTTTSRDFNGVATTTAPNWWRGCNTAAGDLDGTANSADKPTISFTTGRMTVSGAHQIFSNINVTGAHATLSQVNISVANARFDRCRIENTNAATGSIAVLLNVNGVTFSRCHLKATSTATRVVNQTSGSGYFTGCVIHGGGNGVDVSGGSVYFTKCLFTSNGNHCINAATSVSNLLVLGCSFNAPTNNGITLAIIPGVLGLIIGNVFYITGAGKFGVENTTGANTNFCLFQGNLYAITGGGGAADRSGFGDSPEFEALSDAGDPFENAGGGDFTLDSGSNGYAVEHEFENLATTVGYADRGAAQHEDAGGGGGSGGKFPAQQLGRLM